MSNQLCKDCCSWDRNGGHVLGRCDLHGSKLEHDTCRNFKEKAKQSTREI